MRGEFGAVGWALVVEYERMEGRGGWCSSWELVLAVVWKEGCRRSGRGGRWGVVGGVGKVREELSVAMLVNVAIGKCMAPGLVGKGGERLWCSL